MKEVLSFVAANWGFLLFILAFIAGLIVLAKKGYEDKVKGVLFYLVCQAEKEFGAGTGPLKYEAVVEKIYGLVPMWARFLISKKTIDEGIESSVTKLKQMLEDKPDALEYFNK